MVHWYASLNFVSLDFMAWDQKYLILIKLTLVVKGTEFEVTAMANFKN